jgi:hypothetical protein
MNATCGLKHSPGQRRIVKYSENGGMDATKEFIFKAFVCFRCTFKAFGVILWLFKHPYLSWCGDIDICTCSIHTWLLLTRATNLEKNQDINFLSWYQNIALFHNLVIGMWHLINISIVYIKLYLLYHLPTQPERNRDGYVDPRVSRWRSSAMAGKSRKTQFADKGRWRSISPGWQGI